MRVLALAVMMLVAAAGYSLGATGDPAIDLLIEKLVEKGVITGEDGEELEGELERAVEERSRREERETGIEEPTEAAGPPAYPELPFDIKVRMQARLDAGDLLVGPDGDYETESDLFVRRARLEIEKEFDYPPIGKELELNITLDADRTEQDFRGGERRDPSNRVDLHYIYADWTIVDAFALKIGTHKLPFSRVSLTSSSRQLLIERPASTEAAKDEVLGDYNQAQVQIHGELAGSAIRYYLAGGDGANNLDAIEELDGEADDVRERRWGNAWIARMEISPLGFAGTPGFVEKKRDDTGIGEDTHLTLGVHAGFQNDIRYATEDVAAASLDTRLFGADLAGRFTFGAAGILTGQAEFVTFERDFNYRTDEEPWGYYLQFGYLLAGTFFRGNFEPALRYEVFDHDRIDNEGESGTKEKSLTAGFNHYLSKHSIKWSYNFVHTKFDDGIAEATEDRTKNLHQLLLQLYF